MIRVDVDEGPVVDAEGPEPREDLPQPPVAGLDRLLVLGGVLPVRVPGVVRVAEVEEGEERPVSIGFKDPKGQGTHLVSLGLFAILAGNPPALLWALDVVCVPAWVAVGAMRLYID